MTQHEYIFVAVSIILGLAITRLLHAVALLIRAQRELALHWSTGLWALSILAYILQLWWVGWELRDMEMWTFGDFLVLVFGSICIYGAAEMALPLPEASPIDFLGHSQSLGRLSALSMLVYFAIGPYVNLTMLSDPMPLLPALLVPAIGIFLTGLIIIAPRFFKPISIIFAAYSACILYATA
ncbi:MAG: hypothetical protein AAGF57_03775 [Pseudomonadota bacterium]